MILCCRQVWLKRRLKHKDWTALPSVPRVVPGREPRQKAPSDRPVDALVEADYQEDSLYHLFECGRVLAEMVRPNVAGENWGGYRDRECLQLAGLARAIQIKLRYPHVCTPQYCLKDRSCCRFFFPWPKQPYQVYDANTERVALQRRLPADDAFVTSHNLYLTVATLVSTNSSRRIRGFIRRSLRFSQQAR